MEGSIFDFATDNQDDILIEGDEALIRGIGISKHVTKRTGGSGYTRGISWYYNDLMLPSTNYSQVVVVSVRIHY